MCETVSSFVERSDTLGISRRHIEPLMQRFELFWYLTSVKFAVHPLRVANPIELLSLLEYGQCVNVHFIQELRVVLQKLSKYTARHQTANSFLNSSTLSSGKSLEKNSTGSPVWSGKIGSLCS